jgi:hypothetical protein
MVPPHDPGRTPELHSGETENHGIVGPSLNTLLGIGLLGYTSYWIQHPSAQGIGRFLRPVYNEWGKWPIAIVFAIGGLSLLYIGLTRIVTGQSRSRGRDRSSRRRR